MCTPCGAREGLHLQDELQLPPELVQPEGFIVVTSILSAVCHAKLVVWRECRWADVER